MNGNIRAIDILSHHFMLPRTENRVGLTYVPHFALTEYTLVPAASQEAHECLVQILDETYKPWKQEGHIICIKQVSGRSLFRTHVPCP